MRKREADEEALAKPQPCDTAKHLFQCYVAFVREEMGMTTLRPAPPPPQQQTSPQQHCQSRGGRGTVDLRSCGGGGGRSSSVRLGRGGVRDCGGPLRWDLPHLQAGRRPRLCTFTSSWRWTERTSQATLCTCPASCRSETKRAAAAAAGPAAGAATPPPPWPPPPSRPRSHSWTASRTSCR